MYLFFVAAYAGGKGERSERYFFGKADQCVSIGDELYFFLDNEENGFTLLQEFEEDDIKVSAWNCIIDAIAIVSRMAYERMGQRFFPEAIEIVDDSTFSHMISSLISCDDTEKDYIASVYDACLKGQ